MKKRIVFATAFIMLFIFSACAEQKATADEKKYEQISAEEAKKMMEERADVIVLDVREQDEYDIGHIPGAVLLPVGSINDESVSEIISDKESAILVYCRSGNRSKTAAQALADLGYTQVYEFGGINNWLYDIEY